MLLSKLLLMSLFRVRINANPRKDTLHPPDPRLVQLDKHSALPRVSVCPRIGLKLLPRLSFPLTFRCSKSCCGGARNTEGGVKVEYSCLKRTTLGPGEGLLDYSNTPKETGNSVVPHATYVYRTHGTTLRSVQSFSFLSAQNVIDQAD